MMQKFVARSTLETSADELYAWHMRPGAFERLNAPWEAARVIERPAVLEEGARVVLATSAGPFNLRWVALHRNFVAGGGFEDVQERGPFAHWTHTHRFEDEGAGRAALTDAIDYALPFGALGRVFGGRYVRRKLQRLFDYRHAITAHDIDRHRWAAGRSGMRVAISGASGLVGSSLSAFLTAGGHHVLPMVRRAPVEPSEAIHYDTGAGHIERNKLAGLDALVHLAGEGIAARRWSPEQKRRIAASRIDSTRLIARTLAAMDRPPRVWVNASAVGFYGNRGDESVDESSAPGEGFLADTCRAWEAAVEPAEAAGVRVVRVRIGVVLAGGGGALAKMLLPFGLGVGGRLGSGRQYMSWVALQDLVSILHFAIVDGRLRGPVNAVAPAAVRNSDFTRTLARVLGRPAILPAPAAGIRLALGEMGQALLLDGARVLPGALEASGFSFRYPDLEHTLRFELGRSR